MIVESSNKDPFGFDLSIPGEAVPDEPLVISRHRVQGHVERLVEELVVGDVVAHVEHGVVL